MNIDNFNMKQVIHLQTMAAVDTHVIQNQSESRFNNEHARLKSTLQSRLEGLHVPGLDPELV